MGFEKEGGRAMSRGGASVQMGGLSSVPKWVLLMISLALMLFLLTVLEINLRLKGFHFDPWRHYARFGQNFEAEEIQYYERDNALFWKFRPSQTIHSWWVKEAHINSLGLRGPEVDFQNSSKKRILWMGDSGTFGWNVLDQQTYPFYLQQQLNSHQPAQPFEVINAGVPGYSSYQGVQLMQRLVPFLKPDLVLFCYGVNDHNPTVYVSDKNRITPPQWLLSVQNQLFRLRSYQLLYRQMTLSSYQRNKARFLGGNKNVVRVPLEDYVENLKTAAEFCHQQRIKIMFIPRSERPDYRNAMKTFCLSQGIPFLSLDPYLSDPAIQQFLNGEHPDGPGYQRFGVILADAVKRSFL